MVAYKSVYCTLLIVHTKSHRMHIHYWQNEMLIYKYRILYCECLIARFSLPSEKSNAILSPIAAHFLSAFDTVSCALPIDRGFQPSGVSAPARLRMPRRWNATKLSPRQWLFPASRVLGHVRGRNAANGSYGQYLGGDVCRGVSGGGRQLIDGESCSALSD